MMTVGWMKVTVIWDKEEICANRQREQGLPENLEIEECEASTWKITVPVAFEKGIKERVL